MDSHLEIVRTHDRPTCRNCERRVPSKQLMIRRELLALGDVEWWHFVCALQNDIMTEDYLVRLARAFKGPTR